MTGSEITPFTIYDDPLMPYPSWVRIVLGEKDIFSAATFERVNLIKGEHKTEEFRQKLNYSAKVPVLKLQDGTIISEAVALTEYLDCSVGEPVLTGKTPKEKALIQMWTRRVEHDLLTAINQYFHLATDGMGPEIEGYQNKDWGLHRRDVSFEAAKYFNDIYSKQEFLTCGRFTMADIAVVAALISYELMKMPLPEGCEALQAWYEKIKQRPSVQNRFAK